MEGGWVVKKQEHRFARLHGVMAQRFAVLIPPKKELKPSETARCFKCDIYRNVGIISETFRIKLSAISRRLFAAQ